MSNKNDTENDGMIQPLGDDDPGRSSKLKKTPQELPRETGGRQGPEPTRYGDWEFKGRCIDF
jgi:hypothetical protein